MNLDPPSVCGNWPFGKTFISGDTKLSNRLICRYEGGPLKKRPDMQKAALDNLTVKIKTDIKKNSSLTKIENLFSVQGESIVKDILDGILNRVFEHVEAVVQKEHSEKVQYKSTGE